MLQTTKAPYTIREHAEVAVARGQLLSEYLTTITVPVPPAGYTLAHGSQRKWIGPEIVKRRWILTPAWDGVTDRHSFELWMADHQPPHYGSLTAGEALELAADLTAAAEALEV